MLSHVYIICYVATIQPVSKIELVILVKAEDMSTEKFEDIK